MDPPQGSPSCPTLSSTVHPLGNSGMAESSSLDKILRNFAFILALIEKAASTLGRMNFIWATVVVLGGFSQSLKSIDFWFVSVILMVEGLRILCRQSELATRRSWSPGFNLISIIYVYSLVIQEYSAVVCIALSSLRIQKQQYGRDPILNRNRALNLFYWMSVVESFLTLFGFILRLPFSIPSIFKANQNYSRNKVFSLVVRTKRFIFYAAGKKLFSEYGLDLESDEHFDIVQYFFYEIYYRCINGSVFDGLKIDFMSNSLELLKSNDFNAQLTGARLLSMLVKSDRHPFKKLKLIGTTPGLLERLIEILNRDEPDEKEIRTVAADIISNLVKIPENRIRVMAIPGSRESIISLLRNTCANPGTNIVELGKITPTTSLARKQDVRDNTHETSGIEADHSDYENLHSVSIIQV